MVNVKQQDGHNWAQKGKAQTWLPVKKSEERAIIREIVKAILREIVVKKENVECYVNIKEKLNRCNNT